MLNRILPEVPLETARLAQLVFNEHNLYLQVGDHLCALSADFGDKACCGEGSLTEQAPYLLALITLFQFIERLNDRQANEALRQRLDWKFALHLPVTFPAAPHLQTCEFRRRLLTNEREMAAFQGMLGRFKRLRLPEGTPVTPTGSLVSAEQIVRTVCMINRLDRLTEAAVTLIEYLAAYHTAWLRRHTQPGWLLRYRRGAAGKAQPASPEEWPARMEMIGSDARKLLQAIQAYSDPTAGAEHLISAPPVKALEYEIRRQFVVQGDQLILRASACSDCDNLSIGV